MNNASLLADRILECIVYERSNTFWNHIMAWFRREQDGFSGNISKNNFVIWHYMSWYGLFYPVVFGKIDTIDDRDHVSLSTKMNIAAFGFTVIIVGIFFFGALFGMVLQDDNSLKFITRRSIIAFIWLMIMLLPIWMGYRSSRKESLERVISMIKEV